MIKLSTINQIVEAILEDGEHSIDLEIQGWKKRLGAIPVKPEQEESMRELLRKDYIRRANEAVIFYKTAMICEDKGIDKAMEYFTGTHNEDEYQEFRTSVVAGGKEWTPKSQ